MINIILTFLLSQANSLPEIIFNPCSHESLLSVEGPATGSCLWTFRNDAPSVQEACQIGARHMVTLKIPESEKGRRPCESEVVEMAGEIQKFECDFLYEAGTKESEACRVGVDKVLEKLRKRIKAAS